MKTHAHYIRGSVTRAASLREGRLELVDRPRPSWEEGDLVVAEARARGQIEVPTGRVVEVEPGDQLVGALGVRAASLEIVGDWRAVGDDRRLDALSAAGVLGRCTSASRYGRSAVFGLDYLGHLAPGSGPTSLMDTVVAGASRPFTTPTILILGTSMSAGKTTAAKAIIRSLSRRGLRVAGAKLAGMGRRRDVLAMEDAGAQVVFDFVDAGLPSTVVTPERCAAAITHVLNLITAAGPDVLVAEAGASPLEPYNGDLVARMLLPNTRLTVLCASDPYAVPGLLQAAELRLDVVAGLATSTSAAVALLHQLVDVEAIDLFSAADLERLDQLIRRRLAL